jgi:hypothetical protein
VSYDRPLSPVWGSGAFWAGCGLVELSGHGCSIFVAFSELAVLQQKVHLPYPQRNGAEGTSQEAANAAVVEEASSWSRGFSPFHTIPYVPLSPRGEWGLLSSGLARQTPTRSIRPVIWDFGVYRQ